MKRMLGLTLVAMLVFPVATTAKDDPLASDVCLKVTPGEELLAKGGVESAYGLRNYTKKAVSKGVQRGTVEVLGPGQWCGEEPRPSVGVPRDDLTEVRPTTWTKLEFRDDGRRLDVHYVGGVPSCYGLDRVEVTMDEAGLDVRVFIGRLPPDEAGSCILPTHSWVTTVDLGELMAFGSAGEARQTEAEWSREVRAITMAAYRELAELYPGYLTFFVSEYGIEDFRFTSEGRRWAEQRYKGKHADSATKDTLVTALLQQEGLNPALPPYPGRDASSE